MQTKYSGYAGKVMLVDLSRETVSEYPWNDEQRELYLGGKIMAARILCDHLTGSEDAFSEDNWLIISTGPLTGTGAPSTARFNISALSPLTGILASSNCGGSFGFHLKKAGYDAIILKGKCKDRRPHKKMDRVPSFSSPLRLADAKAGYSRTCKLNAGSFHPYHQKLHRRAV